jgi:hypothetical protein
MKVLSPIDVLRECENLITNQQILMHAKGAVKNRSYLIR